MTVDAETVQERLRSVEDPELGDDLVSLGLVNDIEIDHEAEQIAVDLALGAPYSPAETAIAGRVRKALAELAYEPELSASVEHGGVEPLPGVKNVIAVASGKGGVGKSTVASNLAAGLADLGARVGLFDADVYGPNAPTLLGGDEPPAVTDDETLLPPERFGVRIMSMDFLIGEDDPVIFRGPMVHKVLTQLVEDVQWRTLDYLVVDLPPGTGDTQLSVLQTVPVAGAVIVTTPQEVAFDDGRKGLRMFGKHDTPVLGVVENMTSFRCPDCGTDHDIFGEGAGRDLAREGDVPFLGQLPLDPAVRTSPEPIVLGDGETADQFRSFVRTTADMQGLVHRQRESHGPAEEV